MHALLVSAHLLPSMAGMTAEPSHESLAPLAWLGGVDDARIVVTDRRALPKRIYRRTLHDLEEVCRAIELGTVAGVGAVGLLVAYAVPLHAFRTAEKPPQGRAASELESAIVEALERLQERAGGNLPALRSLTRLRDCFDRHVGALTAIEVAARLLMEARRIQREIAELTERIAKLGAAELPDQGMIATIGSIGPLAKGGNGTALAAIIRACADGKKLEVLTIAEADGGTTVRECLPHGIPVREISFAELGQHLRQGKIAAALAGADRITARGDIVGEPGTYALASLARAHGVPVLIAAPYTIFDFSVERGDQLDADDVTPAEMVDAVITGRGVIRRPTQPAVESLMRDPPDPGVA